MKTSTFEQEFDDGILNRISTKDTLRAIWAHLLQEDADMFSDGDVFFEVGGDSVSAQKLITLARSQGILLTMDQVFLHASLEDMAAVSRPTSVQSSRSVTPGPMTLPYDLPDIDVSVRERIAAECHVCPDSIESAYPCSPMQESIIAEIDSQKNAYVRQLVFRVSDKASEPRLQKAWEETICANPVLRSRICHAGQTSGCLQAVVDEQMRWTTTESSLARFLEDDASTSMTMGDRFFRYTIIHDRDTTGATQRYFVWTTHHALCDGTTNPEVLEEVSKRYQNNTVPPRQPFHSFINSSALKLDPVETRQFWSQSLSGFNPSPWPSIPTASGLSPQPSCVLEQRLSLQQNSLVRVTKTQLLRATWGILMSHYTGTEDVGFGAINNGRAAEVQGIAQMTGPTINLVPIVLRVDNQQSVASFLSDLQKRTAKMIPFEHSGISKIRKYLAKEQSTAADFQTLMVVHAQGFPDAIAPFTDAMDLEYIDHLGKKEHHPFPLIVSFTLSEENTIIMKLEYDERLVPQQQAHNLVHQFQTVLTQVSNSTGETLLGSISPLSENDVAQIRQWNALTPRAEETTVDRLFKEQVLKQPSAVAVCSLKQALTYSEVDAHSSNFAAQLSERGVGPGKFVAVCFEKSIWTVVCILAVFKAGGVYLPIDPAHPEGRIRDFVTTTKVEVAMASPSSAKVLEGLALDIMIVDGSYSSLPTVELQTRSSPYDLAYLLFTSGSTGKPKGILISHSAICTSIKHHGVAFDADPSWRTLQFASHTFDLSICEFLTTLACGGCVCVPSDEDRVNDLAGVITALNANTMVVTPTVAGLLHPQDVPTIKRIVLGGEPITKELIKRWAGHVDMTDSYGPSECAVWCSAKVKVSVDDNPADIGQNAGGNMWIVNPDNHYQLSAIGCVGEIVISGPIVGSGYFNDKATTDAAFVPPPDWLKALSQPDWYTMLYKTGDLARYNPDGSFRIVGRNDTQVKLRGLRIELGEIENQIVSRANGAVQSAFVALPKTGPCSQQIVAVVSSNGHDLRNHSNATENLILSTDSGALLGKLKAQVSYALPDYMVPTVWVALETMPLLISGKIDRRSLRQWLENLSREEFMKLVADPNDDVDAEVIPESYADKLRQLWSEVLDVPADTIGLKSSFLSLGGDSIAAIRVVSLAKGVAMPVTVREILTTKNLGSLSQRVEMNHTSTGSKPVQSESTKSMRELLKPYRQALNNRMEVQPSAKVVDAYPLSPFQREVMSQRLRNQPVLLLSWQMEVFSDTSEVSLERLAGAWKRVIRRHPILRTIFLRDPKGHLPPLQVVLQDVEPQISIASASADDLEPTFETTKIPHVDDCFLPHRAQFMRHGSRHYVNIELDHEIIDGWSLKLLKTELLAAYELNETDDPVEPPSYKAFIDSHRPARVLADNKHWTSALQAQRPSLLSLPLSPQEAQRQHSIHKTVIYLPEIKTEALLDFSVKHSITAASIFDAAWAQTLSAYTGSSDVSFEYVVSGRHEDILDIFDVLGPLINVIPYHLQGVSAQGGSLDLAELARQMQEQRAEDSLHNASNVREVLEQDLRVSLPFNTALNFQRRPTAVESGNLKVDDDLRKSRDPWHFDVLVRVLHITDDSTFKVSFEFYSALFDKDRMKEVAEDFWCRVQSAVS